MDNITLLLILGLLFSKVECLGDNHEYCESPQYLELGRMGKINCSVREQFYVLSWYNSTDYDKEYPVIFISESLKEGVGFVSGEYDINLDGSLIITEVLLKHERTFTLLLLFSERDQPVINKIHVIVTAKPSPPFPSIEDCSLESEICLQPKTKNHYNCTVYDTRPIINLRWILITAHGHRNISYSTFVSRGLVGYTSSAIAKLPSESPLLLHLLACKAEGMARMLTKNESLVLVENGNLTLLTSVPIPRRVQLGKKVELVCFSTGSNVTYFVWKRRQRMEDMFHELCFGVLNEEEHTNVYNQEFEIGVGGSLIIPEVRIKHEGMYGCISGDGIEDKTTVYNMTIIVPADPVVEGCSNQQHCVLEVGYEGVLTCRVQNIRPKVELHWKTALAKEATAISFTDNHLIVDRNGETFDVVLSSIYHIKDKSRNKLTVECVVSGPNKHFFNLTKVDILFGDKQTSEECSDLTGRNNKPKTHPLLWTIFALLFLIFVVGVLILKKMRAKLSPKSTGAETDENIPLVKVHSLRKKDLKVMKKQFLKQLKEKYENLYTAVQPIPCVKDTFYSVDQVFVETNIKVLECEGVGGKNVWKDIGFYKNIIDNPHHKSNRRILEGEPGYGKSMVALKLAFDWCNRGPFSPLRNVDILIFLRLRQLGGVKSIYKAIKHLILPKDTQVTEEIIKDVLCNSRSVLVVLDGYDEYPDRDEEAMSDVKSIIANEMFQDFEVIVTTSTSMLPKLFSPLTQRLKLTGFDEEARRCYVRKAVVGEEKDSEKIITFLRENPLLNDLCQVPLLFAIFVHMKHESDQFRSINSVTSLFRYMIDYFQSNMTNTMDNESAPLNVKREHNHRTLTKKAFEVLKGVDKRIVWNKGEFCKELGNEFYEEYLRTGILVEEEVIDSVDGLGTDNSENNQIKTGVRFYHKLFCEWYAAHYLSEYLQQNPAVDLSELLQPLHPVGFHYLYRFVCGLNSRTTEQIIFYLTGKEGGNKSAILCIFETTVDKRKINYETIKQLCQEKIVISGHDSLLLQRASFNFLDIAENYNINIKGLSLHNCLESVDLTKENIKTDSDMMLTTKIPLEQLVITLSNREITQKEANNILEFSVLCQNLTRVGFYGCVPPRSFKVGSTLSSLKLRNVEVWCRTFRDSPVYHLNLDSGKWRSVQPDRYGSGPTKDEWEDMSAKRAKKIEDKNDEDYQSNVNAGRMKYKREAANLRKRTKIP